MFNWNTSERVLPTTPSEEPQRIFRTTIEPKVKQPTPKKKLSLWQRAGQFSEKLSRGAQKVSEFLGIEPALRGIGTTAFRYLDPYGRKLERKVTEGTATPAEQAAYRAAHLEYAPTPREAGAAFGRLGIMVGTAGLAPGATVAQRIGEAGAIGIGFGITEAIEKGKNWSDTLKKLPKEVAIGGATGLAAGGMFEVGRRAVTKWIPSLMSYTSDVPEGAIQRSIERPRAIGRQIRRAEPETVLARAQSAVRQLRKSLSRQYDEGRQYLSRIFGPRRVTRVAVGKRAVTKPVTGKVLSMSKQTRAYLKGLTKKYVVDTPRNLNKLTIDKSLDLLKQVNELYSKKAVRESAEGIVVRNFKNAFKKEIVNTFGGPGGAVDTFLKNYSAERMLHDAADNLVRAYELGKPKAQQAALEMIKKIYSENKGAYLKVLTELERRTGTSLLDELAALPFKGVLPTKIGRLTPTDLFRLTLTPIISPRVTGIEARTIGRLINLAQQAPQLRHTIKVLILDLLTHRKK